MWLKRIGIALTSFVLSSPASADGTIPASLHDSLGACLAPTETFPYKLERTDPLYETARDDHQRYLEEMEDYVNCLDRERGEAFLQFQNSFRLFRQNFGKDAIFRYGHPSDKQN